MIKMLVLNSYKQIKFSGIGIGGKKNVFTRQGLDVNSNAAKKDKQELRRIYLNGKDGIIDNATQRDSIFPSELDGEAED